MYFFPNSGIWIWPQSPITRRRIKARAVALHFLQPPVSLSTHLNSTYHAHHILRCIFQQLLRLRRFHPNYVNAYYLPPPAHGVYSRPHTRGVRRRGFMYKLQFATVLPLWPSWKPRSELPFQQRAPLSFELVYHTSLVVYFAFPLIVSGLSNELNHLQTRSMPHILSQCFLCTTTSPFGASRQSYRNTVNASAIESAGETGSWRDIAI